MCAKGLISDKIAKFYLKNLDDTVESGQEYFNKDLSLNFQKIYESLLNFITGKVFQELSYDDYLRCYTILKPVFRCSASILDETKIETLNLKWLGRNTKYLVMTMESKSVEMESTGNVEKVLLITAMLEHALGSVYYTLSEQRTPPHLLRDLLDTKELLNLFGIEAITFLRILLGTPNSVNLRNIVWHGFPKPEDISTYYVTILLLIIHTLGNILEEKQLVLIYRAQVQDFEQYIKEISTDLPLKLFSNQMHMESAFKNSILIEREYTIFWTRLLSLLKQEEYWNFILLILPQIELILRIKYAMVNDFDVSAKLDEYYITMDTIFEPIVPQKSVATICNKLISSEGGLTEGALKLLHDLFIATNGPRLRDKVSHGEVAIEAVNNKQLCHILLHLSLHICDDHIRFPLDNYESKFHLNCRAKIVLEKANAALKNLCKLHLATNDMADHKDTKTKENKVKIFMRPKKEPVYMLLIFKIANLLTKTCQNYEDSIASCQTLLAQHELRSRRRRTLMSLLEALPNIHSCLCCILNCLLKVFQKLQATTFEGEIENGGKLLRFLKHTLKITENFVKYSHEESNEWIKAVELCSSFFELHEKLYAKEN